jgi:NarL family two-component system sensor histidine kinase LiaS
MSSSEKVRIARDLHDGIAQDLVALGYSLDLLIAVAETPTDIRVNLRTLRFNVDELISKVREEIFALRSGGVGNIQHDLSRVAEEICGERLGLVSISDLKLPFETYQVTLTCATELLRNSFTHSRASQIDLTLRTLNNRTFLQVEDNGIGGAHMSTTRFGLRGIAERIDNLQGTFTLRSDQHGTSAQIIL